ncbi:MAG: transcriptional regulator [Methanomicrobiales archaeon]|nr:transcriptional regulator [Methanomicrobiales archaeon]
MQDDRLSQMVCSVLLMAGYQVSERCSMRPRSFDLIAAVEDQKIIIKVVTHMDSVNEEMAQDLDQIASHLSMVPVIVGERSRDAPLQRGAVYLRYGIFAISVATLYDYLVEHIPPLIYASPGGLYVNIDGRILRKLREHHQLSLGDLAHLLGVSRRAISKYEGGMGTTLEVAIRLEEIFDASITVPIDILSYHSRFTHGAEEKGGSIPPDLERIGLECHSIHRAPFEALAIFEDHRILTGYGTAQRVVKRASLISNLSQIANTYAMCVITDYDKQKKIGNTLIIGERRLRSLEDGFDLIELING